MLVSMTLEDETEMGHTTGVMLISVSALGGGTTLEDRDTQVTLVATAMLEDS